MNDDIMKACGFAPAVKSIKAGRCPFCNTDMAKEKFTDEASIKEAKISGLCQGCQDEMYGED